MNIERATMIAIDLMNYHGLFNRGWDFRWNNRKRALGVCYHFKRCIALSKPYVTANDEDTMVDTILHEIAHAIAGPNADHGPLWKATACSVGAKPERCGDVAVTPVFDAPWEAICPGCKRVVQKFRRPKKTFSCYKCSGNRFNSEFQLVFRRMR